LCEQVIVSSIEPKLRKELGIKENLIDFTAHVNKNTSLSNLKELFPNVTNLDKEDQIREKVKEKNMDSLKNHFNKLF
jgi:hypothetical protein